MEKYLITQSLLSAWQYVFNCYEACEDDARKEFLNTLHREKKPTTPEMQNGIDFEDLVYTISTGEFKPEHVFSDNVEPHTGEVMGYDRYPKWYDGAVKVASHIKSAPVQVRVQADLTVDGMTFLCYGIVDALKAGTIYDVKFSNTKFNSAELAGKYLDSPQHPMYFYLVPEAFQFKYLVSDGDDIYIETYTREATPPISEIIHQFVTFLKNEGLMDLYKEHWKAS